MVVPTTRVSHHRAHNATHLRNTNEQTCSHVRWSALFLAAAAQMAARAASAARLGIVVAAPSVCWMSDKRANDTEQRPKKVINNVRLNVCRRLEIAHQRCALVLLELALVPTRENDERRCQRRTDALHEELKKEKKRTLFDAAAYSSVISRTSRFIVRIWLKRRMIFSFFACANASSARRCSTHSSFTCGS